MVWLLIYFLKIAKINVEIKDIANKIAKTTIQIHEKRGAFLNNRNAIFTKNNIHSKFPVIEAVIDDISNAIIFIYCIC